MNRLLRTTLLWQGESIDGAFQNGHNNQCTTDPSVGMVGYSRQVGHGTLEGSVCSNLWELHFPTLTSYHNLQTNGTMLQAN